MTSRQALHYLIDELPESKLPAAERYLKGLLESGPDPVLDAFMNAPIDDEPLTPEEEAAIREAEEQIDRGQGIPLDKLDDYLRQAS